MHRVSFSRFVSPLALVVLIVSNVGCKPERKEKNMNEKVDDKIRFQCKIDVADANFTIDWTVTNNSGTPIYLFSPIGEFEANELKPKPSRVYVTVEGDKVILKKSLFEIPDDVDVYMPEVPFLTKVAAGDSFHEKLEIPNNLIANFPYQFAAGMAKSQKSERTTKLQFQLGYVPHRSDLESLDPEADGLYSIGYGEGIENQKILESETINAVAEVAIPIVQ